MITRAHITRRASDEGVDAKTVERDYVLGQLVARIAQQDTDGRLVFKGGTSLRLLHFEDFRYSADLDYSIVRGTLEEAIAIVRGALAAARLESITKLQLVDESGTWWIHCEGPLRAARSVKLDLSADELVVDVEHARLLPRWSDAVDVPVLAYTRVEVTAEKLRCVIQRFQCRDLLDLDVLCESGVDLGEAAQLFARKATHKRLDPQTFETAFLGKLPRYRRVWTTELAQYLPEVPHFDEVERRACRALRRARLIA